MTLKMLTRMGTDEMSGTPPPAVAPGLSVYSNCIMDMTLKRLLPQTWPVLASRKCALAFTPDKQGLLVHMDGVT
jgi:hypothetical protein